MTNSPELKLPEGVEIKAAIKPGYERILTPEALAFVAGLARAFEPTRRKLMEWREHRQEALDGGALPDFLPETQQIRDGAWTIRGVPADLMDRRVEITGPTTRKMIINALNSGASCFMADFEDALSPSWDNIVDGQINLADYWLGQIDFTDPENGKDYKISAKPAVLIIRPRGWHLMEEHIHVDGEPVAGAFVDFGLYVFHNAKRSLEKGSGPYFYLPKMEHHKEAALWNDVFVQAQEQLGLPIGTIKATALIETLPAAFEMDEILHAMRDHIVGLNCGRWDYIFSYIKTLRAKPEYLLPDRGQVVMGKAFLKAYSQLLIKTCHRRGAFAMGGMAAFIPNRRDPEANERALAAVRADKLIEVENGHDGTWVAHPDLVPVAKEVFDQHMPQPNQLTKLREEVHAGQAQLLEVPEGTRSEEGLRMNIRVGVQYIEAWLRGNGAVPLYNLMEDAATAEISRTQVWQWIKYGAEFSDGTKVTPALFEALLTDEMEELRGVLGEEAFENGRFAEAIDLFRQLSTSDTLQPFLTVPAYKLIA
ncbi:MULTISPECIES: malate synthase A [Rhodomicrobium]|uniref:malate synthase A n=1 Tax=Rhodomicrobium TaxID=1068 RepID=UPI000B4ACCE4|nr:MULTISPECIES: malate synthase A [Rhodomicrobium]